jgi:hypothetical protein
MEAMVGVGLYVKPPTMVPTPWVVEVTTTSLAPVEPEGGVTQVMRVWSASTVTFVVGRPPIETARLPPKPVPSIAIGVPPTSGPPDGVTVVRTGRGLYR